MGNGQVRIFTSRDAWLNCSPHWSYALVLREQFSNPGNYSVIDSTFHHCTYLKDANGKLKDTYYPIEILRD
jgi:hypothetical protein